MGVLVDVTSRRFLLQREDEPAALEAVKQLARDQPYELDDPAGVLAAADLVSALAATFWSATRDEHGDLVSLAYGIDKAPGSASDGWPHPLLNALAPHARWGSFVSTTEGDPGYRLYTLTGGSAGYFEREHGLELRPHGPPPRCRPGDTITVEFMVHGRGDEAPVEVSVDDSAQVSYDVETRQLRPGERGRVKVTVDPRAEGTAYVFLSANRDGTDFGGKQLDVLVDAPAERADRAHALIGAKSMLDYPMSSPVVVAAKMPRLLTLLQRYAVRYQERPGAEFLRGVTAATNVAAAFRAASLRCELAGRKLMGIGFEGTQLPGYERYLAGLFWSFPDLLEHDPWFSLGYALDHWVRIAYDWKQPSRNVSDGA